MQQEKQFGLLPGSDKKHCGFIVLENGYLFSKNLSVVEKIDISRNPSLIKDTTLLLEEPLCLNNTKSYR